MGGFLGRGKRGEGVFTEGVSNKKLMLHLLVYNNLMAVKDGHRHSHTRIGREKMRTDTSEYHQDGRMCVCVCVCAAVEEKLDWRL